MASAPIHPSTVVTGMTSIANRGSKTKNMTRIRRYAAALVVVAAIRALTADGAWEYAPGSHVCIGKRAILIDMPMTRNANPTSTAGDS